MCDYPEIQNRINVKSARKQYQCDECYKPIEIGQPYERYDALYDGSWQHYKFCAACQEAYKALWNMEEHLCVPIGEVWNTLCDYGVVIPYWSYNYHREASGVLRVKS